MQSRTSMNKLDKVILLVLFSMTLRGSLIRCTFAWKNSFLSKRNPFKHQGSRLYDGRRRPLIFSSSVQLRQSVVSNDLQEDKAKETLGIVGSSVQASFAGLSFVDTSRSDEFGVVFVLGGPGAGKGTQSDLIMQNYPCVHLSAGELLRQETKKEGSRHGELIESCLVAGKIVPVEISLSLLENAMQEAAKEKGRGLLYLVDGFPRNFDNLDGWVRCMNGVASVRGVLMYQCPLEELEKRILARAENSGRSDDNLSSARKRFLTFESQTVPVVETLRQVGQIQEANGNASLQVADILADQTVEDVWRNTQDVMNGFFSSEVLSANTKLLQAIQDQDVGRYRQLCAEQWFEDISPEDVMKQQEGEGSVGEISQGELEFLSGTKVVVTYKRSVGDQLVTEKRIWSHEGASGWKNIHFSRTPAQ